MKFKIKYKIEDYIGKEINYLTPMRVSENRAKDNSIKWIFRCRCGKEVEETPYRVLTGHRKSCGCLKYKHLLCGRIKPHKPFNFNEEDKRFYKWWLGIRARCYSEKHHKYKIYGGRGITMCSEWLNDPLEFVKWCRETHPRKDGYTIDRIDGNGPYAP